VDAVETGDLDAVVDPRREGAYNRGEMIVMGGRGRVRPPLGSQAPADGAGNY